MPRKTAAQIAKKWATNTNAAGEARKNGVNSVSVAPGEKAAERADAYLEGVRKAKESGKFADGCRSVTLQTWKDRMLRKGEAAMAEGVAAGTPLQIAFHEQHQPICEASREAAKAAKVAGVSGRQRMNDNLTAMENFTFARPRI